MPAGMRAKRHTNTMHTIAHSFWPPSGLSLSPGFEFLPGALAPLHGWPSIAIGLLLCFFGARLFGISVTFLTGLLAAAGSYLWLAARIDQMPALVIALIAGLLCALAVRTLLRVGFFMIGLVMGGSVAGTLLGDSIWVVAVMLASGVVSMLMYRVFIAVICAGFGALLLAGGLFAWIGHGAQSNPYVFPALVAILFIAGLVFQTGSLRTEKDREED